MGCGCSKSAKAIDPKKIKLKDKDKGTDKGDLPESFEEYQEEMSKIYNIPVNELKLVDENGNPINSENYDEFKNSSTDKPFTYGGHNDQYKNKEKPKAFVYGPKKVQTRYMKNKVAARNRPEYLEKPQEYLVDIDAGYVETYNFKSNLQSVFNNSLISAGSRAVYVPPNFAIISGGKEIPNSSYSIDLISGEMNRLDNMFEGREYHAMAYLGGIVYVTGGSSYQDLDSCEMYIRNKWGNGPKMNRARSWHTACPLGGCIYVCGGLKENSIERLERDKWVLLNVKIPFPINRIGMAPLSGVSLILAGGERTGISYNTRCWEFIIDSDQLEEITELPEFVWFFGPGTHFNKEAVLYCMGKVYYYNPEQRVWRILG
ncbi:unnamed protein product [Blepharisma stoltei]|uniref:Uncharacterized protein n=1 Tax=Blepharisma stoltei TaxID=1481888 RepID=A0AAU9JVN0_9CILI|nr:unnamed protein product [Blepharisma stoltei]